MRKHRKEVELKEKEEEKNKKQKTADQKKLLPHERLLAERAAFQSVDKTIKKRIEEMKKRSYDSDSSNSELCIPEGGSDNENSSDAEPEPVTKTIKKEEILQLR